MDKGCIEREVTLAVCASLAKQGMYYIPAASSARHVHISAKDLEKLFGSGYRLTQNKSLTQPGQFACGEKVTVKGPKGELKNVRILGPERDQTQVEISVTDSYKLGIKPDIRMSGDIKGTPGAVLEGPAGQVELSEGVIVSARHVHINEEQAALYKLKNGDIISLKKSGDRETVYGNVVVRSGNTHSLELHIDTDEANAGMVKNGELLELIR